MLCLTSYFIGTRAEAYILGDEYAANMEQEKLPPDKVCIFKKCVRCGIPVYICAFKRSVSRDISGLCWHVWTDLSLNKDRSWF